jgi:hypothetical protein
MVAVGQRVLELGEDVLRVGEGQVLEAGDRTAEEPLVGLGGVRRVEVARERDALEDAVQLRIARPHVRWDRLGHGLHSYPVDIPRTDAH